MEIVGKRSVPMCICATRLHFCEPGRDALSCELRHGRPNCLRLPFPWPPRHLALNGLLYVHLCAAARQAGSDYRQLFAHALAALWRKL